MAAVVAQRSTTQLNLDEIVGSIPVGCHLTAIVTIMAQHQRQNCGQKALLIADQCR